MSTYNEILMMRADTLRRIKPAMDMFNRELQGDIATFAGMQVHVVPDHLKDLLTVPHWKVERIPGRRRRKCYQVVCERRPCAFVINREALGLNPLRSLRIDF